MRDQTPPWISHYGVKGMKWGKRRSDAELARLRGDKPPPPTSKEINAARKSHNARAERINKAYEKALYAPSEYERSKYTAEIRKIAKEPGARRDATVASKLTTGAKVATVLVTGAPGLSIIRQAEQNREQYTRSFLDVAERVTVNDIRRERSSQGLGD